MEPSVPRGYDQRLRELRLGAIQPHSAYLARECLGTLAYDPERKLFLRRHGESYEAVPAPIIGLLDGQPMSIDGDHRLRQAFLAGAESVPVAVYDLAEEGLELILSWDHDSKLREAAAQAGMGYEEAKAIKIPVMPPHIFVEYLREERTFLQSLGVRTYADFDGRLERTRVEMDTRHLVEFSRWKARARLTPRS
jgi:hypothetical protein